VRGDAAREVDGAYGEWLHPNLRVLHVALDIHDVGAAGSIRHACDTMGVEICAPAEISPGAILFFEVGPQSHRTTPMIAPYAATIAVARLGARAELLEALATGASDWLTAPVTPQQVTAALTRVPSRWQHPATFDPFTALPVCESL